MKPNEILNLQRRSKSTGLKETRNTTHLSCATFSELSIGMTLEQDGEVYYVAKTNNKFVTLKNMRTGELIYEPEHYFNNAKYKKVSVQGNYTY